MPLISGAAAVLALQLVTPAVVQAPNLVQVREGPCSYGYDVDVYRRCYPRSTDTI
jgi:hypothetical protein